VPRRRQPARVLGPYKEADGYRLIAFDDEGGRTSSLCATKKEANDLKRLTEQRIRDDSAYRIDESIDEYEAYLRDHKGNKPVSTKETIRRLRLFLPADLLLRSITPERAAALYDAFARRVVATGKGEQAKSRPVSVDYHRNALAEVKSFFSWCVASGWVRFNPFAEVEGRGRRKHGKPQLRIDEARAWMAVALEQAKTEPGAVAALATLLLGVRAQELTRRFARDLDDDGRLLWIEDTKSEAGKRQVEIPELLRPHMRRLAKRKKPGDLLFGGHWRDWPREWVQRICRLAGVPEVTAHGMRGLHSTLALSAGTSGHVVAATLGHEDMSTTVRSYAKPGTLQAARQRAALEVLDGGNRSAIVPRNGSGGKRNRKT
jgi:integrase